MNFFNFLHFINPFNLWNQLFPPPPPPPPPQELVIELEDPQDFDSEDENLE